MLRCLLILVISLLWTIGFSQKILTISDDFESEWVGTFSELYEDVSVSETIHQIKNKPAERWEKQTLPEINKGIISSNFWIRFPIINTSQSPKEVVLALESTLFDRVQFYAFQQGQLIDSSMAMGEMQAFEERESDHRFFIHTLSLPLNETIEVYVLAGKLGGKLKCPLKVYSKQAWAKRSNRDYITSGILVGSILFINLFGLLLFFIIREKYVLIFSIQFLAVFLYYLASSGLGFQYLWPEAFHFQQGIVLIIPTAIPIFKAWFLFHFFNFNLSHKIARLLKFTIKLQLINLLPLAISMIFSTSLEHLLLDVAPRAVESFILVLGLINFLLNIIVFALVTIAVVLIYLHKKGPTVLLYTIVSLLQFFFAIFLYILFFTAIPSKGFQPGTPTLIAYLIEAIIIAMLIILEYRNALSQKDQLQLDLAQEQNQALQNLLVGQETERQRLSQDIHDGISIRLAQIKTKISSGNGQLNNKTFTSKGIAQEISAVQEDLRNISHALNPVILQNFGLKKAINDLIFQIESVDPDIDINFHSPIQLSLNKEQEKHLYYIVQELLNNAIKHSKAKKINISLHPIREISSLNEEGKIQLLFFDNGKGFDLNHLNGEGIGIKNIQSRVAVLGGTFDVSRKENGMEQLIKI